MAWLSPAFPVGSFSYSHGLERAVHDGVVNDAESLRAWLSGLIEHGSIWCDAVLLAEAWRSSARKEPLADIAHLAEALAGSAERHRETILQGSAFATAAAEWDPSLVDGLPAECPYCVAVGAVASRQGVPAEQALVGFLQAFAGSQVQAAIRLSVIGQSAGVSLMAAMEPVILNAASRAARSSLDDLGSSTVAAEIASMNHETQYSRLFRT